METKVCRLCGGEVSETHLKHRDYICLSCDAKRSKEYRETHEEQYKKWRETHRKQISISNKNYIKTEKGKLAGRARNKRYVKRHPEKLRARQAVYCALRNGKLARRPCEICGNQNSQAHHDDYSKPLDVRWLCLKHHREYHKMIKEGIMAKGVPKKDSSGKGTRANRGRGGCKTTKPKGKGK